MRLPAFALHLLLASCVVIGHSFVHADEASPQTPTQWEVTELRFQVDTLADNPVDTPFSATFTNEAGQTLKVPGFYDGDQTYCIRFTPSAAGKWTYQTAS
ncbi:MAG: DUF5060 domain-containing protein, partial [Rhodopirellula bahusiensis]